MEKLQEEINGCLASIRKVRADNIKFVNLLKTKDKTKFYNIIRDLNDFEDILIIDYLK